MPETSKHTEEPPGRAQIDAFLRAALAPPDEELLRRYLAAEATLTDAQRNKVEANLAFNPTWQERKLLLEKETSRPRFVLLRFLHPRRPIPWAVAAAVVLLAFYGMLWLVDRATLSESYALASIDDYASMLQEDLRGESLERDYQRGARALLAAPQSTLGLFLHYDQAQADSAALYLGRAFESTSEPFQRAKIAFFLAKANLMQDHTALAQHWLNRSLNQNVSSYQRDAQELIDTLNRR